MKKRTREEQAKPRPQRSWGKIKWFGGRYGDLDYGFVEVPRDDDIFIHVSQCKCDTGRLHAGTAVTFEKSLNPRKGKYEARWLRLLEDERDSTILESCATDSDAAYSIPAWCAKLRLIPTKDAVAAIAERRDAIERNQNAYIRCLPETLLCLPEFDWMREKLSRSEHIKLCLAALVSDSTAYELRVKLFDEFAARILSEPEWNGTVTWPDIPDDVLQEPAFAEAVSRQLCKIPEQSTETSSFSYRGQTLDRKRASQNMPASLKSSAHVFCSLPADEQASCCWDSSAGDLQVAWQRMSDSGRAAFAARAVSEKQHLASVRHLLDPLFVRKLSASVQVGLVWDIPSNELPTWWSRLSEGAKVRALYRAQAENERQEDFASLTVDGIEHAAIQDLALAALQGRLQDAFGSMHERLQEHVIAEAWSNPEPLRFDAILASCPLEKESKVPYCEGRAWFSEEDKKDGAERASRAFCPRTGKDCSLNDGHPVKGARIYPDTSLPWESWSMGEMLESLGLRPVLPELRSPDEYLPRLCGWINRLNEIRHRLRCSVCRQMMRPNYAYAKNLARYNMTVVSCQHGDGHDKNIYINHCWGCNAIIDSRESRIQVENYYICIHCGSGPQQSESYSQGDVCPSCGHREMSSADHYARIFQCCSCGHTIRLPPAHRLTGARKQSPPGRNRRYY